MAATTEPTVDANAAQSAIKKKKAKKAVADNTKYQGVQDVMPITLKSSHAKGRHAVASKDLEAGTLVAVEKAAAAIVRNQSFISMCHRCFGPVPTKTQTRNKTDASGKAIEGQKETVSVPAHSCGTCKMAAYCSEACMKQHSAEHGVQCAALAKCNAIATTHNVPLENLRAVLALIGRRAVQGDSADKKPEFAGSAAASQQTPYGCVLDLNANRHYLDRSSIKQLQTALREVVALVPESARVSLSEAVELACIFSTNHHQAAVNGQQLMGVYPFSALYFHHSCTPNCVFVGEAGGSIYVRTLSDVPADTALTVSYADLFQPREQRRRELLLTRHFWCKCRRCSQPLSQSIDRLMDGIQCTKCRHGVMIFEETKEVEDINELMTDISALDQEIQGKFAECESCQTKLEVTRLVEILKEAILSYSTAHQTMQRGDFDGARLQLEAFIDSFEGKRVLSPYNAYLINAYVALIRVCTQLNDVGRAIRYNSIVVERMLGPSDETSMPIPKHYPRLAEYQMSLGDMCLKQVKKNAGNRTPAGRSVVRRYLKEGRAALEAAYKSRVVIFGAESPRAIEAKRLLDSVKKEQDEFARATGDKKKPKKPKQEQATQPATSAPAVSASATSA
ncbi:hypothetical protein LPJ78_005859 [Coemansia sp. RSA 989]|nr:hypothetical protein BX667DRAFT_507098 [Coemansia mojavensis]KAJ1752912.1 hypothetical protein LPJ79_000899 [Coemansia sp. RSA 1821]KAJ1860373.1 hypothetical protein LPJ78_005859 [Coemansia sp. RSA 989]KAJ1875743.1 hypothetical protein LPJ55_000369 [Coemansia sp. RSA 990]KAJ2629913.1 hypothetical protein H4R22_003035 [Coemansia sp. RSA 1290]KAJ2651020.1 hypothetical protein IWW40_002039 [Coemansia sp. RSA 1250]